MRSKLVIYRNKPMLNAKEAKSFLAELTNNQVTIDDLLEIGKAYNLKAYLRTVDFDSEGIDHMTDKVKYLKGSLHECVTGLQFAFADEWALFDTDCIKLYLNIDPDNIITGRGLAFLDDEDDAEVIEWRATPDVVDHIDSVPLFFIPTDIENLAAQINGNHSEKQQNQSLNNSALLLIGRALELYLQDGTNRNQDRFVSDIIEGNDLYGLKERTIKGLLSKANKALEEARKKQPVSAIALFRGAVALRFNYPPLNIAITS